MGPEYTFHLETYVRNRVKTTLKKFSLSIKRTRNIFEQHLNIFEKKIGKKFHTRNHATNYYTETNTEKEREKRKTKKIYLKKYET